MAGPIVHWSISCLLEGSMRTNFGPALLLALPFAGLAQPPAVVQKVCGACHPVDTVTSQRRTRTQWQDSITQMVERGAKGTPEELAAVLDYLARNNGPTATPAGPPAGGRAGRGPAFLPGPA